MILHSEILDSLLKQLQPIDFKALAGLKNNEQLKIKHYCVTCIDEILNLAVNNDWGLGRNNGFMYLYNGEFWQMLDKNELRSFLGKAAENMGVDRYNARYHAFKDELYKQFLSASVLPVLALPSNVTLVNLTNGTFEITPNNQALKMFRRLDFIKYQLPFSYNENAVAPLFESYLNTVLPDEEAQQLLSEYLGYIFIQPSILKLEKALLLYGSGANGKSVFFEIISALLGQNNVSNYSLQKITTSDYSRAQLSGKLLNYASETNGHLDTAVFKQLVSGEPVEARLPYGEPFTLTNYAKLIFNCNELPKDVEHTDAFFRRFIIIPFNVTIPKEQQDKKLAEKIISNELAGVFNWVLRGLKRLLENQGFSDCLSASNLVDQYKSESNSARLFLDHYDYIPSDKDKMSLPDLYFSYRDFCRENGYTPLNNINFKKRLEKIGVTIKRANVGYQVYLERKKHLAHNANSVIK